MEKDLNYWKNNAEEDYMKVPISVLRYITELEKIVLTQADVSGRSELLLAFGKFIDADCDLLGNGYIEEMVKKFGKQ